MERIFQKYLFEKHILVCNTDQEESHIFETLFALANLFGISVTSGKELVQEHMISLASDMLGVKVPEPFYKGFPQSVRELSQDQLLFDQLVHYTVTYGYGHFAEAGHSLFEETFHKMAFQEKCEIKEFEIITETEAIKRLGEYAENLLASTRPLNDSQFALVRDYIKTYRYPVKQCASKHTAVRLLISLRSLRFARFLMLSDVIKVVEELYTYGSGDLRKLNLRNQDRKLITELMNELFAYSHCDLINCYEKKALWCGLLHHIHYQPKCEQAREFVEAMRSKGNKSVYSAFEMAMSEGDIRRAVEVLKKGKGAGALLRNLNYIVSRIEKPEDLTFTLESIDTKNNIILLQLLLNYAKGQDTVKQPGRSFRFVKHGTMRVHMETEEEITRRKSVLSMGQNAAISGFVEEKLRNNLKGKLGKVYVEEEMKKIALPLQESASQGGFGVLTKGSRIPIPEGKKIRAFTYWEKVNDIDLSVIGITSNGSQREFSWRTMAAHQSEALTFSGDETSGYHGGSEYFDIDLAAFQKLFPDIRYLIFCDNVFSGSNFDKCFCKAGFMMRDLLDSGEIYEPKTVQTAFRIDCPSTFAYLFGVDLRSREMIWLNVSRTGNTIVAGETKMTFLLDYFHTTNVMNVHRFFEMAAIELVSDPAEANLIVSDRAETWQRAIGGVQMNGNPQNSGGLQTNGSACATAPVRATDSAGRSRVQAIMSGEGDLISGNDKAYPGKEWIHSYDFEKLLALMNQK